MQNIKKCSPSTTPHGYCRPRTFLPATSSTVELPTTAKGIHAFNSLSCCLNSSSSSLSQSGNWYICAETQGLVYHVSHRQTNDIREVSWNLRYIEGRKRKFSNGLKNFSLSLFFTLPESRVPRYLPKCALSVSSLHGQLECPLSLLRELRLLSDVSALIPQDRFAGGCEERN